MLDAGASVAIGTKMLESGISAIGVKLLADDGVRAMGIVDSSGGIDEV
jgi:hypothetical protein